MSVREEYEELMKKEPTATPEKEGAFFIDQIQIKGVERKEIIDVISEVRGIKRNSAKLRVTRAITAARRAGHEFDGKPIKNVAGTNEALETGSVEIVPSEKTVVTAEPTLEELAEKIRYYTAQVRDDIINIGKCLIQVKAQLAHGQWHKWIKSNTSFSTQTAHKFMQCAARFEKVAPARELNSTQMMELLALPAPQLEDFFEKKETVGTPVKNMTKMELREEIKKWKEAHTDETNSKKRKAVKSEVVFKTVKLKVLSEDEAELARLLQVALNEENRMSVDSVSSLQTWIETLSTPEND